MQPARLVAIVRAQLQPCRSRILPDRGVLEVTGEDRTAFLQGLVSNDVALAAPGQAVFAALLTPQGKWLAEFFILADGERLLLDCEQAQAAMLAQRLSRFRLRSKVALRDASAELPCMPAGAVRRRRPARRARPATGGSRLAGLLAAPPLPTDATAADWDRHRLALGLPDGSARPGGRADLLLEAGFDELHGVSWTKGCYMGQELTARTKYRGLLKRRLVPVAVDGPLPAPGTPVLAEAAEVGEMRSGRDGLGIAQLRLEALDGRPLRCGEARADARASPAGWSCRRASRGLAVHHRAAIRVQHLAVDVALSLSAARKM